MKLQNILVLNLILLLFIVGCSNNSPEKNNIAEKSIQQSEKFNAYCTTMKLKLQVTN